MHLSPLDYVIWTASLVLLAVLVFATLRRHMFREFPCFCTYVIFHFVDLAFEFWLVSHNEWHVGWLVWRAREFTDIGLILAVVWEIFSRVLRPYAGLWSLGIRVYWYGAALLILISSWIAKSFEIPLIAGVTSSIINLMRSLHFVELSLILVLFVFARVFGLTWRHFTFGIALGYGVKAAIQVVASSVRLQVGFGGSRLWAVLEGSAFVVGLSIWTYYFVRSESMVAVQRVPLPSQLARWNEALEGLFVH